MHEDNEPPAATRPRDARISYGLAAVCLIAGLALVSLAAYSMSPGACGNENGCTGGRDATPLTGIAVGGVLLGVAWAAWKKGRALSSPL